MLNRIVYAKFFATATVKDLSCGALSEALKNMLSGNKTLVDNVIKEIEVLLTYETKTKLDAFIKNHTNVVEVIKALDGNITELGNDTNRSVECLYYRTYEDIGNNNKTTSNLTLQDV